MEYLFLIYMKYYLRYLKSFAEFVVLGNQILNSKVFSVLLNNNDTIVCDKNLTFRSRDVGCVNI